MKLSSWIPVTHRSISNFKFRGESHVHIDRNHTSSVRRLAVAGIALCLALLTASLTASAQGVPTITGYLSNFDVPNNVKDAQGQPRETEGFEIQLEGIQPADVVNAFGEAVAFNALNPSAAPLAPCYIRYCRPQIIQYATGIYVRWTVAGFDRVTQQFTTRFTNSGLPIHASTPPIAAGVFFAGHQCWAFGLASYPTAGCEHFGVSLRIVPVATTYRWIVGDPTTGVLTYADGTQLPTAISARPSAGVISVPILAPAAQIVVGQIQAVIQAPAPPPPPPAALARRYGVAQWVKVYKKEIDREADLDELVGGHPKENVPGILGVNHDVNAVAETEWKLLQLDTCNTGKGGSQLVNHGGGSHGVVRRYEFYKYTGPVVASGGNARCGGATQLSTDNQEASLCQRDPLTLECLAPGPGELGDFIGAQNAAQNLNLNDGKTPQTITFAALPDHNFGDAPFTLNATGGASGNPVTFGTVGACSVLGQTLTLTGVDGCIVTAYQAGNAAFAPAADVLRSFFIINAVQTISFNPLPAGPFKYGDLPFQVSATSSSGLTVAFAGIGACTVQGTTVTIIGAGKCSVTASQTGDANHGPAAPVLEFTNIAKAALTVAADHATKGYGSLDPPLTFSAIGFVRGDTAAVLTGAFTRAAGETVGKYAISQGTLAATNYSITLTSNTLDITPALAKVTAGNGTKTFGALDGPIPASATGFLASDGITVSATRAPGEKVGSYATTATAAGAALTNYNVTFVAGSFSITPALAKVTVSCPASVTFTGLPLTPCTATFSTVLGLSGALTVSYKNNTAVGTAGASATYAGDANHTGSTGTSSFLITAVPATIAIVNPGPQVNTEGDEVEIRIRVVRLAASKALIDDDENPRGVFVATGLPGGLHMTRMGVIHGDVEENTAGVYQVTVTFTEGAVTVSQTFVWTIKNDRQ